MRRPIPLARLCSVLAVTIVLAAAPARAAASGPDVPAAERSTLRIHPKEIQVGMFYRGARVHVEGTAPAGYRVALVCLGEEGKVELKRKGKVWGLLWMNVGSVSFERVPSLYLASTEPAAHRPSRRGGGSGADGATLAAGYEGMAARALPARADDEQRTLFRELVKLKESERLYSTGGGLTRAGSTNVSGDFFLPASVPPGTYRVQMLGYRGDAAELLATGEVTVERVGLAAFVSSTAARHGLLYGVLSVILAIAAGFLTGVLFRMASKRGH